MTSEFTVLPTSTPTTAVDSTNDNLSIDAESQGETASVEDQSAFDMLMGANKYNTLSETFYNTEDKKKEGLQKNALNIGVARSLVLNGVASSST